MHDLHNSHTTKLIPQPSLVEMAPIAKSDRHKAACLGRPAAEFYPEKGDTAATLAARAICATCPIREACLFESVDRCEDFGIWGGAGEQRRRTLRRALVANRYERVAAAHFRSLDNIEYPTDRYLLQSFGDNATHGKRGVYAKGCRCELCEVAASFNSVGSAIAKKRRRKSPSTAVVPS